ncbi:hypothetical protein HHJ78_10900 [Mobiluncus mulieris]|uniref:Terminase small subunit actinomycetes phage-type domain-containing protein n=1 Tax=Mobiluncus mulieris TaxID=2052 RepID=A0A7Y0U392_9ACTO|nr:hypothetical protein [Mobiluncus mulieris]NMW65992.1 hypothetical protein [Mobiluncus mulieris]
MSQPEPNPVALFLAAVPLDVIAEKCGFKNGEEAQSYIALALGETIGRRDPQLYRDADLQRLDRLFQVAYAKAMKDHDLGAIDKCLNIMRIRAGMCGDAETGSQLCEQLETTIAGLECGDPTGVDAALVEMARALARNIDYQVNYGSGLEATKALYLGPHLVNVLRELGATPAARDEIKKAINDGGNAGRGGQVSQLEAFREAVYKGA